MDDIPECNMHCSAGRAGTGSYACEISQWKEKLSAVQGGFKSLRYI